MTPAKLLIAQRLIESAHELRSIVALMEEYRNDPAWADRGARAVRSGCDRAVVGE